MVGCKKKKDGVSFIELLIEKNEHFFFHVYLTKAVFLKRFSPNQPQNPAAAENKGVLTLMATCQSPRRLGAAGTGKKGR